MKAIFVIGDKLLDVNLILSVRQTLSELALIMEYQTSDNIVVSYFEKRSELDYWYNYILNAIEERTHPIPPAPEPPPIPDKPDAKITLAVLQLILQDYALLTDITFRNGESLPPSADFNNLLPPSGYHYVYPAPSSTSYVHAPTDFTAGVVICGNVSGLGYCIVFPAGTDQLFFRTYSGSAWSAWGSIPSFSIIQHIQELIPSQASTTNQLADKDFVNSSIATNTSYFKGTFDTLEEIQALTDVTNNDYAFWRVVDSSGNVLYKRYKYNALDSEWVYEYDLNNSSFTAEQWAAINSGITDSLVESMAVIDDGTTSSGTVFSSEKVDSVYAKKSEVSTFDECHPIGEIYIQFPNKKSPQELYGRGTWTNISSQYAGLFFRAEGGNASTFGTNQSDMIKTHTDTAAGSHNHTAANYVGQVGWQGTSSWSYLSNNAGSFVTGYNPATSTNGSHSHTYGNATDNPETRPVNTAIRIWERTA